MCNPRRIDVTAARHLSEAWEHEIRRLATLSGAATGEARISERLDASIGAPTLAALSRVLQQADGWQVDGDSYRYALDGGFVAYHADTRELEIVAQASETVEAAGHATLLVRGTLDEQIRAEGSGVHYDDNWGGITAEDARREAERNAELNLAALREQRLGEQRAAAASQHVDSLDEQARAAAGDELSRLVRQRSTELRADAAARLSAVGIQGRNVFHRVLAEAYRDAVLAYARVRGANGVNVTERDGVLEIEFEIQV